jgi:hypothetical protein
MVSIQDEILESCEILLTHMWNQTHMPFDMWLSMNGGTEIGHIFAARYRRANQEEAQGMYDGKFCVYKLQCFLHEANGRTLEDILDWLRSYLRTNKIPMNTMRQSDEYTMSYFS